MKLSRWRSDVTHTIAYLKQFAARIETHRWAADSAARQNEIQHFAAHNLPHIAHRLTKANRGEAGVEFAFAVARNPDFMVST